MLENLTEEILKAQGNVAITIIIVLLEDVGHALEGDAALDKEIKAHDTLATLVVGSEEQLDELGAEAVAEGDKSVAELGEGDVTAAVGIETIEEGAPRGEEGPETTELLETNGAASVRVEHADHHTDGVGVKCGPVAVDESCRELPFGELAGAYGRKRCGVSQCD